MYGGSGGGFLAGQSQGESPGQKSNSKDGVRPVTIQQILKSTQVHPDADLQIDGVDVGSVTFVGAIRNVQMQATNQKFSIEDGTGGIEVRTWNTEGKPVAQMEIDSYVRVVGAIKSINEKKYVAANHMRPISDMNEVNYHFLDSVNVHLQLTRAPLQSESKSGLFHSDDGISGNADSAIRDDIAHLSPLYQRIILAILAAPQTNEGIHINTIANEFPDIDLVAAVADLSAEGVLYTTIDDYHVKATIG